MCPSTAPAHVFQYITAVPLRQIDIENDQRGTGHLRVIVELIEQLDGLLSILSNVNGKRETGYLDRLLNQEHICFIVLDNQDMEMDIGRRYLRRGA